LVPKAVVKGTAKAVAKENVHSVYKLVDDADNVVYVGRTRQGVLNRYKQHLGDPKKQDWIHDVFPTEHATNLTLDGARVMEQQLINQYRLQKHGGQFYNRINSISPSKWAKHGID